MCCLRDSMQSRFLRRAALLIACGSCVAAQEPQAKDLLARGLHLADLYNWADAAPAFTKAEKLFASAGDQRNTLYARLGRIRSNIEREQKTLPKVSAMLAEELEDDPLLQNDKELRMFCFIVKGDVDTETDTGAIYRKLDPSPLEEFLLFDHPSGRTRIYFKVGGGLHRECD